MAHQDNITRNSVRSHGTTDIALRDLDTPANHTTNERTLPAAEPRSRFSADSDENNAEGDNYNDSDDRHAEPSSSSHPIGALLSRPARRPQRYSPRLRPEPPLEISGTAAVPQAPRPNSAPPRQYGSNYENNSWRTSPSIEVRRDDIEPRGQPNVPLLSKILFNTIICVAQLCAQAGLGQTLPVLKGMESQFEVLNPNHLCSSVAAYAVALGIFVLNAHRLGEAFGNKRVFIAGLVWSTVWSPVIGASFYSKLPLFTVGRVCQAIGAACTLPTGLAMLRATRPPGEYKGALFKLYGAMSPIGLVLGALGGNILAQKKWWPWVFWVFSITLVVLGPLSYFAIPSAPPERRLRPGWRAMVVDLDLPGMISGTASCGLLGFAWSQAYAVGWQEPYIWVCLIMSVVLGLLFFMIEVCYSRKPLIPYSAMSPKVILILVVLGCGWSGFGIWLFYGWQFLENNPALVSVMPAVYFIPVLVVGCLAVTTTRLILKWVEIHAVFCLAMLCITVGCFIMSTVQIQEGYWEQPFPSMLLMAWGVFTSVPVATTMVVKAVNKNQGNVAATLVCAVMYCSLGLGLGISGTVERHVVGVEPTPQSRLRSHRVVGWMSVGLAGLGFVTCLGLMGRKLWESKQDVTRSYWRERWRERDSHRRGQAHH
ncbi:major facilitator superfamily domain-containing protein [Xylaria arbuscula]|nr:major facilitator superfamily domain-containing protein [Xylaria arbuscula]